MKKRLLLVFVAVILVISLGIWLLAQRRPPSSTTQPTPAATPKANLVDDTVTQRSSMPEEEPSEPSPPGYAGLSDPRWKERKERLRIDDVYEWKTPIDFFGRVVDENMRPVAGAVIDFSWNDTSATGTSLDHTTSDPKGQFALRNRRGRLLQVRVRKDGYYTADQRNRLSFDYAAFWDISYHQPNANDPVLFHLRKKGEGEQLIHQEVKVRLSSPGVPTRFDLFNKGRVSAEGQLEIAAVTNPEMYPPRLFDWWATVAVPGGGLLEFTEEFPFEAPETGYAPRAEFKMPADATNWRRSLTKNYFIRFGNPPKYGRVEVELNGDSQNVYLEYWVNPSGSRNLEPSLAPQVPIR